jgi:hypothetical protein
MKQRAAILAGVILLVLSIFLMVRDMTRDTSLRENPFAYELNSFDEIGLAEVGYSEVLRKEIETNTLTGISIDHNDHVFLVGDDVFLELDAELKLIREVSIEPGARNIHASNMGSIFIGTTDQVRVYNREGKWLQNWPEFNNRSVITSIVSENDNVYIADAGNKKVLRYDRKGNLLRIIGEKDSVNRPHGFIIPSAFFDLAIGREDELWVVNSGLHTFEKYDRHGNFKSAWTRTSMNLDGFSGCCNPSHIALLSDGAFVTSEKGLVRVKVHEPNGDYRCVVARPGDFEPEEQGIDIAVNSKDEIFLIVPSKKEVRKYVKSKK